MMDIADTMLLSLRFEFFFWQAVDQLDHTKVFKLCKVMSRIVFTLEL